MQALKVMFTGIMLGFFALLIWLAIGTPEAFANSRGSSCNTNSLPPYNRVGHSRNRTY